MNADLQARIEALWEIRESISPLTGGEARVAVESALEKLDSGELRVAECRADTWVVNTWLKQAVLLSFRLNNNTLMQGAGGAPVWDKVEQKFAGWGANRFTEAGFRAVPGAIVRRSAYIAPGVVLMPCFVNVGAYIDRGTMIDTWATIGSCAQIGRNCHISAASQIGGVLEPVGALPVIIEDDVLIGGNCGVYEGSIVKRGAVLGSGTILNRSTPVYDIVRDQIYRATDDAPLIIPADAVVVAGSRAITSGTGKDWGLSIYTPIVVKYRDSKTDAKIQLEDLLR